MERPLVSVLMTTYGHELYITEAIQGVLMQRCQFNFELIIANDCSPDNTDAIIKNLISDHPRSYLVKYKRHAENRGMMSNFIWTLERAKGQYFAICEGDDYWIDPFKLQKQVDYLLNNAGYGVVFTDSNFYYQDKSRMVEAIDATNRLTIPTGYVTKDLLYRNLYKTCTVLFKRPDIKEFTSLVAKQNFLLGDKVLWLYLSETCKFGYLPDTTAVRRVLSSSASHFNNFRGNLIFRRNSFKISLLFCQRNNLKIDKKKYKKIYFNSLMKYSFQNRLVWQALRYFWDIQLNKCFQGSSFKRE